MTEKVKNYLGIAIIIGILVFAYAAWSYVGTYSKSAEPSSFRSFSVSGEGKVVTVPDVATFTFSVVTEGGRDLSKLQKENIDKTNRAIAFVKNNKVDQKDIKTEGYNINPRYQYYECNRQVQIYPAPEPTPCPPPEIVGYTITQTVGVKVRDFSKVGDIVAGVVLNGANSVSGLTFTIDDRTKAENDAREEAISKAKDKAKAIARAGGFNIGRLLSIEEGYQPYYGMGGGTAESVSLKSAAAAPAPTIEPGSQEVKITVTLRYEIK